MRQDEDAEAVPVLEVFADYACPWSWLLHRELERLGAGVPFRRVVRAVELWPAPVALPSLDTLRAEWESEVEPLARELGAVARFPELPTRTRKAHEMTAFARTHGCEGDVHAAIFRARYEDGLDIGRIDVLVAVAEAAGLDRTEARIALDIDQFADAVAEDRRRAEALGVRGLPAVLRLRGDVEAPSMRLGFTDAASLRRWILNGQRTESE